MKKRLSLRVRILLSMVGILLVSTLLILFVIREISRNKIESDSQQYIEERHEQFDSAMLNIINRITYTYLPLFDNSQDLYDELSSNHTIDTKTLFVENLVENTQLDENTFGKISIYYEQDLYNVSLDNDFIDDPSKIQLENVLTQAEGLYFVNTVENLNGEKYFVFAQHISTIYPNREIFGLAVFYLQESLIEDALSLLTSDLSLEDAYSFIYNDEQNQIYALQSSDFSNEIYLRFTEENYIITENQNQKVILIKSDLTSVNNTYSNLNFSVVSVLNYDVLFADYIQLNQYIIIVGLAAFIILIFLATRISEKLTKPVRKLIEDLRIFKLKNKKEGLSILSENDEIYELEKSYDEMIDEIIRLIDENNTEMENKRKLELYALQMQINPHFLYNTLDTIAWLAKLKNEKDIEHLVLSLAKFFRLSLHKGDKYIKIHEEIALVQSFLEIEKMRFPDLFEVEYQIEDKIKNEETLKLILQPIVENAIKHGFSDINYLGKLKISVYEHNNHIIFEVNDNGLGFNPDDDLFAEDKLLSGLGGYGLKNVDERIKLEYGRIFGVHIKSEPKLGTTVTIEIQKTHVK